MRVHGVGVGVDPTYHQLRLLEAIQNCDIDKVQIVLADIPATLQKIALLERSQHVKHRLRTPLLAAAASGDMDIFTVILRAVGGLFHLGSAEVGVI